mmetsp:Transcript_24305/g.56445  ORF Transcript_24305/g.56445 Transcript_24305/m.56445 type:complete len:474 (+) Transcript_24305:40-1461(+)
MAPPGSSSTGPRQRFAQSAKVDRLLGNGAKQVARCTLCTRPLGCEAAEAGESICSRCSDAAVAMEKEQCHERPSDKATLGEEGASSVAESGVSFLSSDADAGVEVRNAGGTAMSSSEDAWLGVRATPAVLHGAYWVEFEIASDCLLRVGWSAPNSRRALGTDDRSFGYGGTGMKSHANRFEPYGKVHEGAVGSVLTCLLDRRDARSQKMSYMLDGSSLGVAFKAPVWMANIPLHPAVCGREDWKVHIHATDPPRFAVPPEYRPLSELATQVGNLNAEEGKSRAAELFAPAPKEAARELRQLDVPDENLLEFRSSGDETLDVDHLETWLQNHCEVMRDEFHMEMSESGHTAVVAFASHRLARSVRNLPPPMTEVELREAFSEAAVQILVSLRPEDRGETTDKVARRFIAGALADDAAISKQQLRQIRGRGSSALLEDKEEAPLRKRGRDSHAEGHQTSQRLMRTGRGPRNSLGC